METIKARYRNKLKKVIIEVWNGERWLYVKTLSNPLIEFNAECLEKVSENPPNKEQKEPQRFAQSPLTEPLKKDTFSDRLFKDLGLDEKPKKELTEEEIKKLGEMAK